MVYSYFFQAHIPCYLGAVTHTCTSSLYNWNKIIETWFPFIRNSRLFSWFWSRNMIYSGQRLSTHNSIYNLYISLQDWHDAVKTEHAMQPKDVPLPCRAKITRRWSSHVFIRCFAHAAFRPLNYIAPKLTEVFRDLAGLLPLESQLFPNGNLVWLQRMYEKFCCSEVSEEQEGPFFSLYNEQLL